MIARSRRRKNARTGRSLALLGAGLVTAVVVLGAGSPAIAETTTTVSGTVSSTATGDGIPAHVSAILAGETEPVATVDSDANGDYRFEALEAGRYDFRAVPLDSTTYLEKRITGVLVQAGQPLSGVDITLDFWPSISGTVTIDPSLPIDLTDVEVRLDGDFGKRIHPNADGTFTFTHLSVNRPYSLSFVTVDPRAYPTVFYNHAESFRLEAGQHLEINATIQARQHPNPSRIEAPDRYSTSFEIYLEGQYLFQDRFVYIASGENYPDALAAGAAAAHQKAPLLLTQSNELPVLVRNALDGGKRAIVVGGPNSVSETVMAQIEERSGRTPIRIAGSDRFETSRKLAEYAFTDSQLTTAYIATGTNFPDALAAGSPAGHQDSPVILVNGQLPSLDKATTQLLQKFGSERFVIAGGPASVSAGIEADLGELGTTVRLAGSDRYSTAIALNEESYPDPAAAVIVTGEKFPDALSAAPWAAVTDSPVYLSQSTCVPQELLDTLRENVTAKATLVGGVNSLSQAVAEFTPCR